MLAIKETVSKRFLNVQGISEYLCLSEYTIRGWVRNQRIPFSKLGRSVRFDLRAIEEWLSKKNCTVGDSLGIRLRNSKAPITIRPEQQKDGNL